MNNYKFRAWHDNKMWDVRAIDWDYKGKIISCHLDNGKESIKIYPDEKFGDEVEIMQYTDRNDINGNELYIKDIYKNNENGCIGEVECLHGILWLAEYKNGELYNHLPFYELCVTDFEIIGNKFENPEILEVANEA